MRLGPIIVAAGWLMAGVLAACAAEGAPDTLPPVDETASDPDFAAFKDHLDGIVANRDADALLAIVAPDVKNSFGGDDGKAAFIEGWKPADPTSPLWGELEAILALGITQEEWGWVGPSTFSRWPDAYDPFDYALASAQDVPLLADPCDPASVVVSLHFAIVKLADPANGGPSSCDWSLAHAFVDDEAGHRGYVAREQLRSPLDHRAAFNKIDGEWRLVFLVAGD